MYKRQGIGRAHLAQTEGVRPGVALQVDDALTGKIAHLPPDDGVEGIGSGLKGLTKGLVVVLSYAGPGGLVGQDFLPHGDHLRKK